MPAASSRGADGGGDVTLVDHLTQVEQDNQRLQALTRELVTVEERTRARLARVIHDDLQQILVAASFSLGRAAPGEDPSRARTRELLARAIQRSREICTELSPPILDDGSLEDALRWLARETERLHELQVDVRFELVDRIQSDDIRRTVFRLVQEALLNVCKHARTHRAWVSVHVDAAGSDVGEVVVAVEDRGRGFDGATRHVGFGTRTLRQRIENFGGRFALDSTPGEGTRLEARLPGSILDSPATATDSSANHDQSHSSPESDDLRVLIVDDHELVRTGLADLVASTPGHAVAGQAETGQQALDCLGQIEIDVILLDVNLPDLSGIEVARRARALCPQVRIVGLSMHDDPAISAAMLAAGADTFLSKSAPLDDILAALA